MKKALFTLAIALLTIAAQAQFKIHDDGWVSVGSLTKTYGVQVQPNCYTSFRVLNSVAYGWGTNSISDLNTMKHWIVTNRDNASNLYGQHVFYVSGNGTVWAYNCLSYGPNPTIVRAGLDLIDKEDALASILQLQGCYYDNEDNTTTPEEIVESEYIQEEAKDAMIRDLGKRNIGLDVSLLGEVVPDAVRTDTEARLCINYNAVITLLVEAVKQQQEEIKLLQKTLEENGLTRK